MKTQIIIALLTFIIFSNQSVLAAKKRVWTNTVSASATPSVSASLSRDRKTVKLYFSGLKSTISTSYELTYTGNELDQGVYGSIKSAESGNTANRPVYFGTCSNHACTAHRNVKNARLAVTFKLKNGKEIAKSFRLKI